MGRRLAVAATAAAVALLAGCVPGPSGTAGPGDLDTTFASPLGWTTVDIALGPHSGEVVRTPPIELDDGSLAGLIEIGARPNGTTINDPNDTFQDVYLVTIRPNGTLRAVEHLPFDLDAFGDPGGSPAPSIAAAPGARIVAAAGGASRRDGRTLYRFDLDAHLDPSFGTAGAVTLPAVVAGWELTAVRALDVDVVGRTYVVASATSPTQVATAVLRLDTTGALDATFGSGGATVLPASVRSTFSVVDRVDVDVDLAGRAHVLYPAAGPPETTARLSRLTSTGEVDGGYAGIVGSLEQTNSPLQVTLDGQGRALVVRYAASGAELDRLTTSGMPDAGFGGGDGSLAFTDRTPGGVELGSGGRILVRMSADPSESAAHLLVLDDDGSPATTVAPAGLLRLAGAEVAAQQSACNDVGSCLSYDFAVTGGGTRLVFWGLHYASMTTVMRLVAP